MSALFKRKSILIIGFLFIIIVALASQNKQEEILEEKDKISFAEGDLDELGKSLEGLEFDDLGGLSMDESIDLGENSTDIELTELDLDKLGELLQGLEFEDLGGLTED